MNSWIHIWSLITCDFIYILKDWTVKLWLTYQNLFITKIFRYVCFIKKFLLIVFHNGLIWINVSSLFANFVTRNTCFFVKGLQSFARVFRLFAKVLRLYCNNFIYYMIDSFLALWLIGSNPTISNKQNVIFTRTWPMRSI